MMAKRCDGKTGMGDGLMIVDDQLMSKGTRDVCPMCKASDVIMSTVGQTDDPLGDTMIIKCGTQPLAQGDEGHK